VFGAAPARGGPSIVVGNERRGIRPDVLRAAARTVQIPMPGRGVNTLNVATAAAVAMYYLLGAAGRRNPRGPRPESHRPGVLLAGPRDHVEAGSTLRSAAAFGWRTVGLDDRDKVWFGTPRPVRTEGRAAARSHRNPLRVVPVPAGPDPGHTRIVVAGPGVAGPPLHRAELTGPGTLLVIPDGPWDGGRAVEYARVDLPGPAREHRYRLVAGIVLAEAARQLGARTAGRAARDPRGGLSYGSGLALGAPSDVDLVTAWELAGY